MARKTWIGATIRTFRVGFCSATIFQLHFQFFNQIQINFILNFYLYNYQNGKSEWALFFIAVSLHLYGSPSPCSPPTICLLHPHSTHSSLYLFIFSSKHFKYWIFQGDTSHFHWFPSGMLRFPLFLSNFISTFCSTSASENEYPILMCFYLVRGWYSYSFFLLFEVFSSKNYGLV